MTLTADFSGYSGTQKGSVAGSPVALPLWRMVAITLLAVCIMSLPNLLDPIVRHDDYPALFGEAHWFWGKTLHEGRWINYFWHLRGIITPAWLNFAVYQALWAILAASIAVAAMGRNGQPWFVTVLALFILASTPATLISLWFNTLIPGLAIVTLYAVLGCRLSQRSHRALLPVFVILSFMAYTTYPLLLLVVCLVRTQNRTLRDLTGLMVLFVLSFAVAILVTYTLNWQVHGVFGVPLDDWRKATPAHDVAGMVANLPILAQTVKTLMVTTSYNFAPAATFHLGLLFFSTVVMLRYAPREALYLHAGLWAGMALVVLQTVKIGVQVPPRAFIFAWVFYAVIVVRATAILSENSDLGGRLMRNLSLLVVLSYLLVTFYQYTIYRPWQAETRTVAAALIKLDPNAELPVLVYGDVMTLDSAKAAHIQKDQALVFRIQQLTGHRVIVCDSAPKDCAEIESTAASAPMRVKIETEGQETRLSEPLS